MGGWQEQTYLGVGAGTGHDATLDGEPRAVAAGITSDDSDLSVGGNEGSGDEGQEDRLCEHFEGSKRVLAKSEQKMGKIMVHVK